MTDVADPPSTAPAARTRWTAQWKELYEEVITTNLCTGCAGCVISCPHDVIGYDHAQGGYKPFHLEDELGASDCTHGQKGCTTCTRACPRYQHWETQADDHLFGRVRTTDEISGIYSDILLTRAADDDVHDIGQDGGLVTAMLLWLLEEKYIDGALVSYLEGDGSSWKAVPGLATTPDEIRAAAGSRYTYSANTLALPEAMEKGLKDLALVGMSCQSSVPPVMWSRKVGKISKPIKFNIGLLCSKTFDDSIFEELFEAKYGLTRAMIKKVNIKGKFQIWTHDGEYHEVPLKECHAWTREGCTHCPDFAAEHADISTGGIGKFNDWTLTIVRTDLGREVIRQLVRAGRIETRPGDDDPGAIELMHKLAAKSRKRWPAEGVPVSTPRMLPPPAPKPEGAKPDAAAAATSAASAPAVDASAGSADPGADPQEDVPTGEVVVVDEPVAAGGAVQPGSDTSPLPAPADADPTPGVLPD